MTYAKLLIDKAVEKCGSRYALAKACEISEGNLSRVYNGHREFPMNWALKVARVAEVDPTEAAELLDWDRAERKKKRPPSLRSAVGGAVALLLVCYSGSDMAGTVNDPGRTESVLLRDHRTD